MKNKAYYLLLISFSAIAMIKPTLEERLAQAAKEVRERSEQASSATTQKLLKVSDETALQSGEAAELVVQKVKYASESLRDALLGLPTKPVPNADYARAVYRARENGDIKNVSHDLVTIAPWNDDLVWSDSQKTHVLMVSWIARKNVNLYFRPSLGRDFRTPSYAGVYCWVTAVPQIKKFIENYSKNPTRGLSLTQRIKKYLGLPDSLDEYEFVEMWVRPQDIFRPCINNDILSTTCIANPKTSSLPLQYHNLFDYVASSPEHRQWYANQQKTTYSGVIPFPWTRLGYTYDWGNEKNHVGASEFVIKQGAMVIIKSIIPTDDYAKVP